MLSARTGSPIHKSIKSSRSDSLRVYMVAGTRFCDDAAGLGGGVLHRYVFEVVVGRRELDDEARDGGERCRLGVHGDPAAAERGHGWVHEVGRGEKEAALTAAN